MSMRKICCAKYSVTVRSVVVVGILVALITLIVKLAQRSHHHVHPSVPDNYTTALHQALFFFNAQRCRYQYQPSHYTPILHCNFYLFDFISPLWILCNLSHIILPKRKDRTNWLIRSSFKESPNIIVSNSTLAIARFLYDFLPLRPKKLWVWLSYIHVFTNMSKKYLLGQSSPFNLHTKILHTLSSHPHQHVTYEKENKIMSIWLFNQNLPRETCIT